jgi:hypothetical protein
MTEKLAAILDQLEAQQQQSPVIPDNLSYDQIADEVIRGKRTLSPQQIRLLIEIYPYYKPKLTAVAHFEGSFAEALERAIEKRANRPPPSLLIEAEPVQTLPAEELKKPFARLRRRV